MAMDVRNTRKNSNWQWVLEWRFGRPEVSGGNFHLRPGCGGWWMVDGIGIDIGNIFVLAMRIVYEIGHVFLLSFV